MRASSVGRSGLPVCSSNFSVTINVNGNPQTLPDGATVAAMLEHLRLTALPAAVEVNRELVPKRRHSEHTLREGDRVEVVTLVGGG